MANPQKAKGAAFERLVADYLAQQIPCERIPAGATLDRGDLWTATAAVQCKNHRTLSLGAWLDDTQQQQQNAAKQLHALVVKRKGTTDPAQQFVVMTLEQFRNLLTSSRPDLFCDDVLHPSCRSVATPLAFGGTLVTHIPK